MIGLQATLQLLKRASVKLQFFFPFLKVAFGPLYLGLVFVICGWYVRNNFGVLTESFTSLNWIYLFLASMCASVYYIFFGIAYKQIQSSLDKTPAKRLSRLQWAKAFIVGYIGRYLPGKIAVFLGRIHYLTQFGFSKRGIFAATLYENLLVVGIALAISVPMLFLVKGEVEPSIKYFVLIILLFPGFFWCCRSSILKALPPIAKRKIEAYSAILKSLGMEKSAVVFSSGMMVVSFIFMGLTFFFVCSGISTESLSLNFREVYFISSVYIFSGVVGLVAIFAPSGIGVREGVAFIFLYGAVDGLSSEGIVIATIITRVLLMLIELLGFISIWLLERN